MPLLRRIRRNRPHSGTRGCLRDARLRDSSGNLEFRKWSATTAAELILEPTALVFLIDVLVKHLETVVFFIDLDPFVIFIEIQLIVLQLE